MDACAWRVTLAAAALMALAAGGRSSLGLFVSPLNTASGMGLAAISFAMALGQLAIGLAQPFLGRIADRHGAACVIVAGAWTLAMSTMLPAVWPLPVVVGGALVLIAVTGSAVGSNGLLIGEVGRAVPAARAGLAVGLVGAGASVGQLLLGPATQWAIDRHGWNLALLGTGALSLLALPLARPFRRRQRRAAPSPAQPVADVLRDARFWRVAASFGVCGFHVAFLAVHMPGVIERCGLPASLAGPWIAVAGAANIAGSVAIGLAMKRWDSAWLLAGLYGLRALGIAALLALPVSAWVMMGFALVMGASHMATLPPTSALIARQHGVERLGTLFGVVMLVHQVGSFAGIWLGGWAAQATGSDTPLWLVDIGLALVAARLVWPRARRAVRGEAALAAS
ncbi:MFS transporter [Piscinibacter sp.]|uniref:MFS transporter n=1 Tax=Piscinibacter sp. TaxID=1903157 RepID=UPI002C30E2BF|nr:MFS transporter [Albitalea sp.]HUG21854.1 MFS transporter [Albitalea sp.]